MKLTPFKELNFLKGIKALFDELNVPVNYVTDEPTTAKEILKDTYKENATFELIDDVYFVGMADDAAFVHKTSNFVEPEISSKRYIDYDGILIFGITLHQRENNLLPTRSQLAEISRAFNREFYYTPVVLVFKYNNDDAKYIAFANTERLKYKQEWREGEKAGKVSLLRDIDIEKPHRGHEDIISQLKIPTSGTKQVDSFDKLYKYWQEVFSVSILNKKFYQELSNWYFWAVKEVSFPNQPNHFDYETDAKFDEAVKEHKAKNVIRLLTRILFIWFIKEKKLIPEELFDIDSLQEYILKEISPLHEEANKDSVYYKAILQNLFFATLNQEMGKRTFRNDKQHQNVTNLMRYKSYFKDPDYFIQMMEDVVPFMNGGLFECLDKPHPTAKGRQGGDKIIYIDGFSDREDNPLVVPDYLFFGATKNVDLSAELGVKNKQAKQAAVKGLIDILKSYKFTITENTPIEEDVALDPELLGKVFENLLASYNPETKTTARKQTGSFYTPREIVNYMVDESLIAYLKSAVNFQGAVNFQFTDNIPKQDAWGTFTIPKQDAWGTFFNPNDEIQIHKGNLPHWSQKNVWYFVTFRLADSIPLDKQEQLRQERGQWLKSHKKDDRNKYSLEEIKEYNRLFSERVENWLNNGYGACVLKDEKNAKIVADAIKYFEGKRYELDEWVVMPNHVHILVKPIGNHQLSDILHSWKSFTSNEINKNIGKSGQLWMHESYDHIMRNKKAFGTIRNYICQNPVKANIVPAASSFGEVPAASSFGEVPAASSFGEVPAASSFGILQSKDALDTLGTLDTMLHQLTSFDPVNPFAEYPEITEQIVYALDKVKVLDPAAGSGAFPMGMLQKMVHILQKLDPTNEMWKEVQLEKALKETKDAYDIEDKKEREQKLIEINNAFDEQINDADFARKLYLIENCIYGVDIQPIATQISKLRFFISLVVDQKVQKDAPNFGIRPLPNLETKFVTANTLIGIDKPKKGEVPDSLFDNTEVKKLEAQLKKIRHKLFSSKSPRRKRELREEDKNLREQMADLLEDSGMENKTARQLASWDPYDQNASSPFFDPEWMFDIKEGFDVVIGNPPYVFTRDVEFEGDFKKYIEKEYFSKIKRTKKSKSNQFGKINLFAVFIMKGLFILRTNGVLTYILPNNILRTTTYNIIRKYILQNAHINKIVDLGSGIFDNVTASTIIFNLINSSLNRKTEIISNIRNIENYDFDISQISQNQFLKNVSHTINLYMDELSQKVSISISGNNKKLGDFCIEIIPGIDAPKSLIHTNDNNGFCELVEGKSIARYQIKTVKKYLEWIPSKINRTRPQHVWDANKKIIMQRISGGKKPLVAALDKHRKKTFNSVNNILLHQVYSKLYEPLEIVLNSDLINWYYANNFSNNSELTVNISKTFLEVIPISNLLNELCWITILTSLSNFNRFVVIKMKTYFKTFTNISNALVFNLYFPDHMKERKIDILQFIEKDCTESFQLLGVDFQKQDAFDTLSDSEKEQIIEKLHQKWTDPHNEVVKRMGMFKEKSPDILKVILES